MKKILTMILGLVAMSIVMTGCTAKASEKTETVRIAIQPSSAFIPLYIAKENGWIEEALKDKGISVTWTEFESGPPMNESFAAGQQDIGVIGDVPAISAIATGQKNQFIANIEGGASYAILVAADDNSIHSLEDLKGKKLATVEGSAAHIMVTKALETVGLQLGTDVTLVNVSAGDVSVVLENKEADAIAIWEPNVSRIVESGTGKILVDGKSVGYGGVNVMFATRQFTEEHADIVDLVLQQFERAVEELNASPEQYASQLKDTFLLEPDLLIQTVSKYDYKVSFTEESIASLEETVAFLKQRNVVKSDLNVKDYLYEKK